MAPRQRDRSSRLLENRLYFFPALLPLASVLPALLSAVGAAAAVVARLSRKPGRARRAWLALGAACLVVAGTSYALHRRSIGRLGVRGTRLVAASELPRLEPAPQAPRGPGGSGRESGVRFSTLAPRPLLSDPVRAAGLVLVGTRSGTLDAFDAASGELRWSLAKREPVFAVAVAASGDRAYVGEGLHTSRVSSLTAVSLPDGRPLWQREFEGHLEAPALAAPGLADRVFAGAGPGGLWCLGARDGEVLWRAPLGHVDATPALVDGADPARAMLVIPSARGEAAEETRLSALDPRTGEERWGVALPGQPWGSPQVADPAAGLVFVTTGIGRLGERRPGERGWAHLVAAREGAIRWTVELPAMPLFRSPVSARLGLAFVTLKDGRVRALALADGRQVWEARLEGEIGAASALGGRNGSGEGDDDPLLAVLSQSGQALVLRARDGAERARLAMPTESTSSPLFASGAVVLAAPSELVAFELAGPGPEGKR